eukprot:CAMPEP_0175136440 /NCGR_PEP_ID=MMETSP0087-20121206/9278_1 /TAXON_ID=136419 /ORGANISM="Unknown Unknown, Strain D1" /LENGTH=908 /DNA_ID=CAMNT_0016419199 /DNA_START=174 /DNA_END=2900 /DNA_ORIENTATION=+
MAAFSAAANPPAAQQAQTGRNRSNSSANFSAALNASKNAAPVVVRTARGRSATVANNSSGIREAFRQHQAPTPTPTPTAAAANAATQAATVTASAAAVAAGVATHKGEHVERQHKIATARRPNATSGDHPMTPGKAVTARASGKARTSVSVASRAVSADNPFSNVLPLSAAPKPAKRPQSAVVAAAKATATAAIASSAAAAKSAAAATARPAVATKASPIPVKPTVAAATKRTRTPLKPGSSTFNPVTGGPTDPNEPELYRDITTFRNGQAVTIGSSRGKNYGSPAQAQQVNVFDVSSPAPPAAKPMRGQGTNKPQPSPEVVYTARGAQGLARKQIAGGNVKKALSVSASSPLITTNAAAAAAATNKGASQAVAKVVAAGAAAVSTNKPLPRRNTIAGKNNISRDSVFYQPTAAAAPAPAVDGGALAAHAQQQSDRLAEKRQAYMAASGAGRTKKISGLANTSSLTSLDGSKEPINARPETARRRAKVDVPAAASHADLISAPSSKFVDPRTLPAERNSTRVLGQGRGKKRFSVQQSAEAAESRGVKVFQGATASSVPVGSSLLFANNPTPPKPVVAAVPSKATPVASTPAVTPVAAIPAAVHPSVESEGAAVLSTADMVTTPNASSHRILPISASSKQVKKPAAMAVPIADMPPVLTPTGDQGGKELPVSSAKKAAKTKTPVSAKRTPTNRGTSAKSVKTAGKPTKRDTPVNISKAKAASRVKLVAPPPSRSTSVSLKNVPPVLDKADVIPKVALIRRNSQDKGLNVKSPPAAGKATDTSTHTAASLMAAPSSPKKVVKPAGASSLLSAQPVLKPNQTVPNVTNKSKNVAGKPTPRSQQTAASLMKSTSAKTPVKSKKIARNTPAGKRNVTPLSRKGVGGAVPKQADLPKMQLLNKARDSLLEGKKL